MKLLVIGVDGGDRRIFDAMTMPNVQRMMSEGQFFSITDDTWARGWAEQLTGQPAHETGGYYRKPKCDGTRDFIETFRGEDYQQQGLKPIWKLLNERGQKVGLMNIPTTSPVPEVDGFFVGGAGGGSKKSGSAVIEPYHCHPESLREELEEMGYILDTRFMASGIKEISPLMDRLCAMTEKRFESFATLAKKHAIDFGYLCNRSLTVMQYAMMSEIEPIVQQLAMDDAESRRVFTETEIQSQCRRLYAKFDECLGRLFEELNPQRWLIVGDHGHVPMQWHVNLNAALRAIGEQKAFGSAPVRTALKNVARRFVPRGMRAKAGKKLGSVVKAVAADTDWQKTTAFSNMVYPGVYLNDKDRFGGPVRPGTDTDTAVDRIVEKLNKLPQFQEHGFTARPYRRSLSDAKFSKLLPDVWVDFPDGYFFQSHGPMFERNRNYGPIASLHEVTNDMYTGMKGQHPIFCVDQESAKHIRDDDPDDLRLAYRVMDRVMAEG